MPKWLNLSIGQRITSAECTRFSELLEFFGRLVRYGRTDKRGFKRALALVQHHLGGIPTRRWVDGSRGSPDPKQKLWFEAQIRD